MCLNGVHKDLTSPFTLLGLAKILLCMTIKAVALLWPNEVDLFILKTKKMWKTFQQTDETYFD
jgi:hypothetical protein